MTTPAIGPRQRAALRGLRWARQVAPADDPVMTSLARKRLVGNVRRGGGQVEWFITYDGSVAIGEVVDDRLEPNPGQEAA